jgi:uncharacterized protein
MIEPLPWWIAGPAIGLFVPVLLVIGNRLFGVSSNFRHLCAAVAPGAASFLRYDWKRVGGWNLAFAAGVVLGGALVGSWTPDDSTIALSDAARRSLAELGLRDLHGLVPQELFRFSSLFTLKGATLILGGGFFVGFGTAYAGGCTSGHAISGLADLQLPSLIAVIGFFAGGLFGTWVVLPWMLG